MLKNALPCLVVAEAVAFIVCCFCSTASPLRTTRIANHLFVSAFANSRTGSVCSEPARVYRDRTFCSMSSSQSTAETFLDALSQAASQSLGRTVQLEATGGGGYSGGGGATTSAVKDSVTGVRYFVKSAIGEASMLKAEYMGVKAMAETQTIKVPTPIAFGTYEPRNQAFVLFEYLDMTSSGQGSQHELGQQLARLHRSLSPNGKFGFDVDNTIGATPQPNLPWMENWADFWDEQRLGHMLRLTGDAGLPKDRVAALRTKTRELLSHQPQPSLIHGDFWGGNKGSCRDAQNDGRTIPCIFDPATYYGDREADVAMTYLFGGFTGDFYDGYESEWPLPDGHENRRTVYNLYHILNHDVLFGGGYINQARGMLDKILKS